MTCLSQVPEDMTVMHKLVASMIHHAADLFKVCISVTIKSITLQSANIKLWLKLKLAFNVLQ